MKKQWIIIACILGILLIAGGGVAYFSGRSSGEDKEPTASPSPSCLLYTSPSPRDTR